MKIKIINNSNNSLPIYETNESSGLDLRANLIKEKLVFQGTTVLIPTGLQIEIPKGYEGQVRPKSGLSLKGIDVKLGTIDSDYRGDIGIILSNNSENVFYIKPGDRIAQIVFAPITKIEWEPITELNNTERGSGGFGHTGIK